MILNQARLRSRPFRVVVVSTHDDRMLALADQIVEMRPNLRAHSGAEPTRVALAAGQNLFCQGDPSDLIDIVESGEVDVVRDTPELGTLGSGGGPRRDGPDVALRRSAMVRARRESALTGYTVKAFRDHVAADRLPSLIRGR